MFSSIQVSDSRAEIVIDEITNGSDTHWRFYALLIASAMIACFGLAVNSTAVIIGAMLVSPLMMPIFGIALGMLDGDPRLLGRALIAEMVGAMLAIGTGYLVGSFELTAGEATGEMLARTQPSLIDLLVAVFAGFAGAYALVDERISPALPGVAIATAIVPPLSTCGMCLSMGAWSGAAGALLLFLANLVSILIVALVVFGVTGLARKPSVKSWRALGRRFGPTVLAFAVVCIILTNSLLHITKERFVNSTIGDVLRAELAADLATELDDYVYDDHEGRMQVLATIRSPRVMKPGRVASLQQSLQTSLDTPVDLVVRTLLAKDVTPTGSSLMVTTPDLDGSFLTQRDLADGVEGKEALAEQVIREYFESEPGFELTNVEYGTAASGSGLVLAYINSIRALRGAEIAALESRLQQRLDSSGLMLLMRVNSARLQFSRGPVLGEWTSWRGVPPSEIAELGELETLICGTVARTLDVIPTHVHFNISQGRNRALVEVVGPNPVSPEDVKKAQEQLNQVTSKAIELSFWYRSEFIASSVGYTTYEALTAPESERRGEFLREIFDSEVATVQQ